MAIDYSPILVAVLFGTGFACILALVATLLGPKHLSAEKLSSFAVHETCVDDGTAEYVQVGGGPGHFAKAFSGRTAKKIYWGLVVGVPDAPEGLIDAPLAKQPGTGGEKMHIDAEHGLTAKTRWRLIDRAGNRAAWLELQPLTGRTHQLRAHMAALGHPIVGDAKYGGAEAFLTGGISRKLHLHARRIRIDAPDGGKIDATAELPTHFAESLATLGFDPLAGDSLSLEQPKAAPDAKQRKIAAAAKARRRERRGERRSRGSQAKAKRR